MVKIPWCCSDPIGSLKLADELHLDLHASNPSSSSFQRYLSKSLLAELRSEAQHELLEGEKKHQTPEMNSGNASVMSGANHQFFMIQDVSLKVSPQVGSMS